MHLKRNTDKLSTYTDARGSLTLCTVGREVPFQPRRAYWIHHVPSGQVRGQHANTVVDEYVVCVAGAVSIDIETPYERVSYRLSSPEEGVVIPSMAWSRQYDFSPDAVLLVLASGEYDRSTYIDTYEEWGRAVGKASETEESL